MQINLLTYLRKSYTLGRWLGMVVTCLKFYGWAHPKKRKKKRLRAYTQIKEKKAWAQAWELGPISLTDWNFFRRDWSLSINTQHNTNWMLRPRCEWSVTMLRGRLTAHFQSTFGDLFTTHPVIVFISTVNNDWSQIHCTWRGSSHRV